MLTKTVLVLGASRYYSKSIEAAKNAGYFVVAVDKNPDSYAFNIANAYEVCDIVDKVGVLALAKKYRVSGIVPVNDYGVPTAAYVAKNLGLPGISEETAFLSTSKAAMRQRWIEKGISCPKVRTAVTRSECLKAIDEVGFPCILKPANGYGGASRGVIVVTSEEEIHDAIEFSQKFYDDKCILIESYIESVVEHSAEVLIFDKEYHIIAISDKVKSPLPYRVDKNVIYPTAVTGYELERLKKAIIDSVKALDINIGAAHVEIATTEKGPVLFELGARTGGGGTPNPIVPFVTGIDYFSEIVRILCGDTPKNIQPTRSLGCSYHFLTPPPGVVKDIEGLEKIKALGGILDFEFYKRIGDQILPVTVGTERSGFIIAGSTTREEAYRIGVKAEELLRIIYE